MASKAGTEAVKALNPAMNPRTVHFWAPVLKWGLVIAGISDFWRPVDQLSLTQNAALFCTGTIWTRWCMIIKPKNVPLAAVNAFLAGVGTVQLSRIGFHHWQLKKEREAEEKAIAKTA